MSTPSATKSFFDMLTPEQLEELERVRAAMPRLDEVILDNAKPTGPARSER